jgi:rhodanese-related sulfurtransferase
VLGFISSALAEEVNKGEIPDGHLDKGLKTLPWNVSIWDMEEALPVLKSRDDTVLWVDTRPSSFFDQGTVANAIMLLYDKKGSSYPENEPVLTEAALKQAVEDAGTVNKIVFFCQGPKCHRSYNAAFRAVTDWGYDPGMIVWFRDGYPVLFKEVMDNPRLKRRATRFLSEAGAARIK